MSSSFLSERQPAMPFFLAGLTSSVLLRRCSFSLIMRHHSESRPRWCGGAAKRLWRAIRGVGSSRIPFRERGSRDRTPADRWDGGKGGASWGELSGIKRLGRGKQTSNRRHSNEGGHNRQWNDNDFVNRLSTGKSILKRVRAGKTGGFCISGRPRRHGLDFGKKVTSARLTLTGQVREYQRS